MARPNTSEVRNLSDAEISEKIEVYAANFFSSALSRPRANSLILTVSKRSASSWPSC